MCVFKVSPSQVDEKWRLHLPPSLLLLSRGSWYQMALWWRRQNTQCCSSSILCGSPKHIFRHAHKQNVYVLQMQIAQQEAWWVPAFGWSVHWIQHVCWSQAALSQVSARKGGLPETLCKQFWDSWWNKSRVFLLRNKCSLPPKLLLAPCYRETLLYLLIHPMPGNYFALVMGANRPTIWACTR